MSACFLILPSDPWNEGESNLKTEKATRPGDSGKSSIVRHTRPAVEPVGGSVARGNAAVFLAIFLLALSVRLTYLSQIEASPLFYDPAGDGRSYDEWARRIAAGDFWGREVFYQAPLYPYFLGLLQILLGPDLWAIRLVQICLGAVSCGVIFLAGEEVFGRGAGVAAGSIVALYAPAIFYEALIQKAVLDLVLTALFLVVSARSQARPGGRHWVASGAIVGLLALSRENALVWIFVVPIWMWFYFVPERPRARLGWIFAFLAGSMLVLVPVGLRNLYVGGEFVLTTSQIGANFYIGNNPDANGMYTPLRGGHGDARFERQDATELAEQALGRKLLPSEVSRFWLSRAVDYIVSRPADWLRLIGKKWLLVWNVFEVEDADDFYLYQKWSSLLGALAPVASFGFLAPLAAVGLVLTRGRWRQLSLLYALLASFAASVAMIYVFGRYRFPLVPMLALFAGAAVVETFALWRARRVREIAIGAVVGVAALVIVHWPVAGRPGPSAAGYNNVGNALARQGRFDDALESYREALALAPDWAAAHYNLGNLMAKQGDHKAASNHYREAIRLSPDFPEAYWNLGNVVAEQGDLEEALELFRKGVAISSARAEGHFYLGTALAKKGQLDEAVDRLRQAIAIKPDYAEAYHHLGTVLGAQGNLAGAVEAFRAALGLNPESADAHEGLAMAYAQMGEKEKAARHYEEALRIMKSRPKPRPAR